jgi:hypothetical protein
LKEKVIVVPGVFFDVNPGNRRTNRPLQKLLPHQLRPGNRETRTWPRRHRARDCEIQIIFPAPFVFTLFYQLEIAPGRAFAGCF